MDAASSTVIKYSSLGKKRTTIPVGEQPENASLFHGTTDVAFGPDGRIFITDGYGNARVLEYSPDGKRWKQWGKSGTGPAEFQVPHAIQIDEKATVYVDDRDNGRIEKFDVDGNFLEEIPHLGRIDSLKLVGQVLWVGMAPLNRPPGSPGVGGEARSEDRQDIGASRCSRVARRTFHRTDTIYRTTHHTRKRIAMLQSRVLPWPTQWTAVLFYEISI
ncbi:MAG TPA: 6-bladed beta-propeller [Candidatus Acidoferrales bacterium]|nr:6-bladed beta-propeller [Candidatus Acidoferrales bacterium]